MKIRSVIEKWLPLVLLGSMGMFLSEFLIWNHAFQIIRQQIPVSDIPRMALGAGIIYFFLFLVLTDVVQRCKINDVISLFILGSVYGLVIEGVWANTIFDPVGFGPRIFGIWLIHLSFTALSWHPLIDFALGFIFLKMIFKGQMNLGENKILPEEIKVLALFCLFWFIWSYARWFRVPGIPLSIHALTFLYPITLFGILFYLIFKYRGGYVPGKILGAKAYFFLVPFLLYFVVKKFITVPNKSSFAFFCFVILAYVIMFVLYITFARKKEPQYSIYEEGFPIAGTFRLTKYLKLSGLVILFYAIFRLFSVLPAVKALWLFLTTGLSIGFVVFSIWLPLYAVMGVIREISNRERGESLGLGPNNPLAGKGKK